MARHQLTAYDAWGHYLFGIPQWIDLLEERGENDIGILTLTLDESRYAYADFRRDTILMFERAVDGISPYQLVGDTLWMVRAPVNDLPTSSQAGTIQLVAQSMMSLLDRRIVAFFDEEAESEKLDLADDMMREIVTENLLGTTDFNGVADRSMAPWLTVGPDKGQGQYLEKKFAWLRVLQVLQEIAQTSENKGTYLAFDIVCTQPPIPTAADPRYRLEFKTWATCRGQDRRTGHHERPVRLGPDRSNLENVRILNDWLKEETVLYVGGEGEGALRDIETAVAGGHVAGSPFGRIEGWYDERDMDAAAELQDSARAALQGRLTRARVSGIYVDTPKLRYGRDVNFGDLVTLEARGVTTDVRISFERLHVSRDSAEQIELTLTEIL